MKIIKEYISNPRQTIKMEQNKNGITTFIENAVEAYKTKTDTNKNTTKKLHISKIDNVEVDVYIRLCKGYGSVCSFYWALFIDHSIFTVSGTEGDQNVELFRKHFGRDDTKPYTIKGLVDECKKAVLYITKLKIDAFLGVFIDPSVDNENYNFQLELYTLLKDDRGEVELKINECCVCYTPTYTKTGCRHHVCMPCISKLEKEYCSCDGETQQCPMCREDINTLDWCGYDWFKERS